MSFNELPVELIQHVVSFLSDADALAAVCASPRITMPRCDLRRRWWRQRSLTQLAAAGDLPGVKYLLRLHKTTYDKIRTRLSLNCGTLALEWASEYGHLPVVQYLHATAGYPISEYARGVALNNGHEAVVEYFRREGCEHLC